MLFLKSQSLRQQKFTILLQLVDDYGGILYMQVIIKAPGQ